ncbi:MAG TPA: NlpC/P60 family protein [Solirubrobacterales bacterium]|nr:NlpC/P60 family protein [Solirubrobacterales bacterium]
MGANRKELLAAAETGLVESGGFHNLREGDADSEGWRQERVSLFGSDAVHPKKGAQNFFNEAKSQAGTTAGELAANVQRPAEQYRGRYDEVKPEAVAIVRAFELGSLKPAQRQKLQKVTKEAQDLGLKAGGAKAEPPPKQLVTRFKAAKVAMQEVEGTPYVWGGGHNTGKVNPTGGLDCSGAVSYVLQHVGVKLPGGVTSGDMGAYLKPGPGLLTVYYNAGHTFLKLGDEYWGTSVGDSGAGGLGRHDAPSASYLSQYNVAHVPGMGRKQLLQMGFKGAAASGNFASPGITYSEGGTVATIDPGAAATMTGKPGFSKKPIRLTPLQKYRRTKKALHELGVGESSTTTSHTSGSVLSELEKKYLGAAA